MMAAPDPVTAALIATNDPAFYNDTIRNLAAPWTNRDQSVFVPLNDYTATVVGMVRDNVPFNTLAERRPRVYRRCRRHLDLQSARVLAEQ